MSEVKYGDWYIEDAPKTLEEVYGQDVIVNHIRTKQRDRKFDKSTLFLGQFGSGKTVLAKILAKSIACKNIDKNGAACNDCPTCISVNSEKWDRDVIYLNGEQMSAQEVDQILDNSLMTPAIRDAAKVFIVDETQGLSPAAIQKFLAATQSPKPGFFFIFTAMSKLAGKNPGALMSRCKNWKMKIPQIDEIYKYLGSICVKKKLNDCPKEFLTTGLQFIAENSEYSFRKAIQMLEQCYDSKIFETKLIKETFDIVSYDDACEILVDLANGEKTEKVFTTITGMDYQDKFPLLLTIISQAAVYRTFGLQFIEEHDKWKWKNAALIANGKYFFNLCNVFTKLSETAYLKRGAWQEAISNYLYALTPKGVSEPEPAPVKRRVMK